MRIDKCQDLMSFLNQVEILAKSNKVVWQGKIISKDEVPVTAKNIKSFIENNTDWFHSCKASELNANLKILLTRSKDEIASQDGANELIVLLDKHIDEQNHPTPKLPDALWQTIFSHVAKTPQPKIPSGKEKTVKKEKKSDLSPQDRNAFQVYKNLALVSRGWRNLSTEAKAQWVNSHELRIDDMGFKDANEAVKFILACGEKLHYLNVGFEFSDEDWQRIFKACPNLLALKIRASNNTDKAFGGLKDHPNIKQLVLTYNPKLTQFPELGSAKNRMLELGLLDWPLSKWPDLNKMTDVRSLNISYTADPLDLSKVSMPPKVEDLFLFHLPGLTTIPQLAESSNLKKLSIVNCKNVSSLPILSTPSKLEDLLVVEARHIKDFPMIAAKLKTLTIDGSDMVKMPNLSNQNAMVELKFVDCQNLEEISEFRNLISLQKLSFEDCPKMASLPSLNALGQLSELRLKSCKKLSEIPSLESPQFAKLEIDHCEKVKKLPQFKNLAAIKYVFLHRTGIKGKKEFLTQLQAVNPKAKVEIK